jgi:hypothetical protein
MSPLGWFLQKSIRVGLYLPGFVPVEIGVSNSLVPTKFCNKIINKQFCGFVPKGFPHKFGLPWLILCMISFLWSMNV